MLICFKCHHKTASTSAESLFLFCYGSNIFFKIRLGMFLKILIFKKQNKNIMQTVSISFILMRRFPHWRHAGALNYVNVITVGHAIIKY